MTFLRFAALFSAITSCLVFVLYVKDIVYAFIHDVEFSYTFLFGSISHLLFYLSLTIFFIAFYIRQKDNA